MRPASALKSSRKPIRTCLGCRTADFKSALVRLVANPEGVCVDTGGRLDGRGGYLHPRKGCVRLFVEAKVKTFVSLRQNVTRAERQALAEKLEHLVSLSHDA